VMVLHCGAECVLQKLCEREFEVHGHVAKTKASLTRTMAGESDCRDSRKGCLEVAF